MSLTTTPLISMSMVTYNHEKYIGEAIQSVLNQTVPAWQLVVVNDGSTDGTRERIEAFKDPRILCINQENRGPNEATNRAVAACRGKYLTLMSGDDVCYPDRFEKQLEHYRAGGRRLLFGLADFIDDDSRPLTGPHFASTNFDQQPLRRAQILERFFSRGANFLNGITVFTEHEVFREAGPYDPAFFQLGDFDLWIRIVKKYEICVSSQRVLQYRIRSGNENLSCPDVDKQVCACNETYLIMRRFFDDCPPDLFKEAFGPLLIRPDFTTELEYVCEQAFLYLKSAFPLNPIIGIEKLHQLLADPPAAAVLKASYGFTHLTLARLLKQVNVLNLFEGHESSLFIDAGDGWRGDRRVSKKTNLALPEFHLTFDLAGLAPVRSLRWAPMQGRWCRVQITSVCYRDAAGRVTAVDEGEIHSNGVRQEDGAVVFERLDPMFFLPVAGDVHSLTIAGRWQREELRETVARLQQQVGELRCRVGEKEHALNALVRSKSWRVTAPLRFTTRVMKGLMK